VKEATPAQLRLAGQIAVEKSWANTTDRAARTRPAREAFFARFEREVDPESKLEPAERRRRAEHAMKSYMAALRLRAMKAARLRSEDKALRREDKAKGLNVDLIDDAIHLEDESWLTARGRGDSSWPRPLAVSHTGHQRRKP